MQSSSFAPVLSATLNLLSCCTISSSLLSALYDFNQSPSLILGKWSGLHYANGIALMSVIFLIMSLEFVGLLDDLVIKRMANIVTNCNYDGLVHLVADNDTHPGLSKISLFHGFSPFSI
jgi:hypothetical protein